MKTYTAQQFELTDIPRWAVGIFSLSIIAVIIAGKYANRTYQFWRLTR